jgi:hypothetical protein
MLLLIHASFLPLWIYETHTPFFFLISKRNIIKNAKRVKYTEYTRGASKTEKKKEQENHES